MLLETERLHGSLLTRPTELEELAPEWEILWNNVVDTTPFQHPGWQLAFARHLVAGSLRVLTFRVGAQLVAVLPLYNHLEGSSRQRKLLLLGAGLADYQDILVQPEWREVVLEKFFKWLGRSSADWDLVELQQLPEHSALLGPLPVGFSEMRSAHEPCPIIDWSAQSASEAPSALRDILPAKLMKNIHYYRRRAGECGEWHCRQANATDLDAMMVDLIRLHSLAWRARGQAGVLADPHVQAFHLEAARELFAAGLTRVYALEVSGRVVAIQYGFAHNPAPGQGCYYHYLTGFDPFYEMLSPGTLLMAHAAERALEQRLTRIDFLRGREGYKYLWGSTDRTTTLRKIWLQGR